MAARKPTAPKAAAGAAKSVTNTVTTPISRTVVARPVLQWLGAAVGAVVTLGAIAVIAHEVLEPARPVAVSASITSVRQTASGWMAEIEVANAGSTAAAAVTLEGRMGDKVATAALDYVPGDGEVTAFLRFPTDPRTTPATVVVTGWTEP